MLFISLLRDITGTKLIALLEYLPTKEEAQGSGTTDACRVQPQLRIGFQSSWGVESKGELDVIQATA